MGGPQMCDKPGPLPQTDRPAACDQPMMLGAPDGLGGRDGNAELRALGLGVDALRHLHQDVGEIPPLIAA